MYQLPHRGSFKETLKFGVKSSHKCGFHIGVDLVGLDSKNIYPICAGVVESINSKGSAYGKHCVVRHSDGLVSLYAHMDKLLVSKGDSVSLETILGVEGTTGNVTGKHLHLELHKGEYKYPPSNSSPSKATWLVDPLEHISKNSIVHTINVEKDGKMVKVDTILHEGTNYIKLRDMEKLANISVGYNSVSKNPTVTTKKM